MRGQFIATTILVCLWASAGVAVADETPSAAPPEMPAPKVLVLPLTFTVYQGSLGAGIEAVPDWTNDARRHLEAAIGATFKSHGDFEVVPMPELTEAEKANLRDEIGLVHQIVASGVQFGRGEWHKHVDNFDPSIGDGLDFLRQKAQADYAVIVDGSEIRQSGGQIFMQFALAAAGVGVVGGAGANVNMAVLDLEHQAVQWFNSTIGIEAFGVSTVDVRTAESAQKVISQLMKVYPTVPALAKPADAHVHAH